MTVAHVVPFKGALIDWLGEQLVRDSLRFGIRDTVVLKSDQEPAIVDVLNEIARMRSEGRTIIEHSPVADPQANGFVERSIQTVEKILSTHLLALEDKVKATMSVGHPIFGWLVEYCADLYNRYQLGTDGKTAMQRLKVKRCMQSSVEFAQHIMFWVVGKVQGGMMKERWMSGLYLGKRPGSEENLVMTEEGKVVRARAIKEMHKTLRMEALDKLMGTPHDPVGTLRAAVRDERRGDELVAPEVEDDSKYLPKRVQITKPIIEQFGPTSGCRKCQAVMSNNKGYQFVHHTTECRDRLTELMRQDERFRRLVEAADERQVRRLAEVLERRDQATQQRQQRQEVPARPARGEARDSGGASGSQEAPGGQKRKAEQQLNPGDDNEEGDCEMEIPLATESSGVGVRKRGAEESTEMEEEPARQ